MHTNAATITITSISSSIAISITAEVGPWTGIDFSLTDGGPYDADDDTGFIVGGDELQ